MQLNKQVLDEVLLWPVADSKYSANRQAGLSTTKISLTYVQLVFTYYILQCLVYCNNCLSNVKHPDVLLQKYSVVFRIT